MHLKEAGLIFVIGSVVITLFQITGVLDLLQRGLSPITERFLGLPGETSTAFIMGIVRRDFGAAGLYGMELSANQVFISLIVITLFVPCRVSRL
jgi:ferrous iron transport protein B